MTRKRTLIVEVLEKFDVGTDKKYFICGRLITKRQSSNFIFLDVRDASAKIQAIIIKSELPDVSENTNFNPGDFYAIVGYLTVTKSGEKSIMVRSIERISFASKSLLKTVHNPELIIQKRYLDLIANPKLVKDLEFRSRLVFSIRSYLFQNGYIEADTPILHENPSVGTATPFMTRSKYLDRDFYLRGTCEIKLKQLIVGGYEKVFEIGPVFRNESESLIEFPLLEIEAAYHTYMDMADLVEKMFKKILSSLKITSILHEKTEIDLVANAWARMSVLDAIKTHYKSNLDIFNDNDVEKELIVFDKEFKHDSPDYKRSQLVNLIIKKHVVHKLIQPTFLINYPKYLSPLASVSKSNPFFAERGYLYIGGQRLCEVVSEENDSKKQLEAFQFQDALYGNENHIHHDLVDALDYGCPPTGGVGLNINRLVSLFTGSYKLRDNTFFPLSIGSINK